MPSRKNVYRTALAYRDLRLLIAAFAQSQLGDFLFTVALIVYVYDITHSAAWVAALTVLRALPRVILQPFGGAIADRYDRRLVMVACDLARAIVMGGMRRRPGS